jgi:hypothetical protein
MAEALALTKRLLDLAYGGAGSRKAVPLPLSAPLRLYAVLGTICQPVAHALGEPQERISVEMGLRAFDHYRLAVQGVESDNLRQVLSEPAQRLGIVKRQRKAHRERQQLELIIWGDP